MEHDGLLRARPAAPDARLDPTAPRPRPRRLVIAGLLVGLALALRDVAAERAHMRREETEVLPRAQALLTPEDWRAVDEAFARNSDPAFGENIRAGFEALAARITRGAA